MKNKLLSALIIFCSFFTACSQNAKVDANGNFTAIKKQASNSDKKTGKTFTDTNGIVYDVFESKNGKLYYFKTSAKSGNIYKVYIKTV